MSLWLVIDHDDYGDDHPMTDPYLAHELRAAQERNAMSDTSTLTHQPFCPAALGANGPCSCGAFRGFIPHADEHLRPPVESIADEVLRLRAEVARLTQERDEAHRFIEREGYRRCDVMACNCGSWHGGHMMARFDELARALDDADVEGRGTVLLTLHGALAELTTLRQQQTPQPIETVPKHGVWVLVNTKDDCPWVPALWHRGTASFIVRHGQLYGPTHWLPLPPPTPRDGGAMIQQRGDRRAHIAPSGGQYAVWVTGGSGPFRCLAVRAHVDDAQAIVDSWLRDARGAD